MSSRRRLLYRAAAAGLFAALGGCASTPTALGGPGAARFNARQARLVQLQEWQLSGRISITQADEGWHASLRWQQQPVSYTIDLIGPLGSGRATVYGLPQGVELRQGEERLVAADPDQLLAQALGVALPINGLRYWVRGIPAPKARSQRQVDADGRLVKLHQQGWSIDYWRYREVSGVELPTRIDARRDNLEIKVIIGQWDLPT